MRSACRLCVSSALLIAILCLVLAGPTLARERMSDADAADRIAGAATDPLAAADDLSAGWRPADAIRVLVEHGDSTTADVLWRLARAHINLAERMDQDEDNAATLYEAALAYAGRAVDRAPDNPHAHLMVATASGRVALQKGPFSAAGLVKDVHRHAHLAAVNSDSLPVAYYILGRTHRTLMEKSGLARRLAGLTFASEDSIAYYFQRALEVSGGNMIQCRVDYAEVLVEQGREAAARDQLRAALALPLRDEHDGAARDRGRTLLEALDSGGD